VKKTIGLLLFIALFLNCTYKRQPPCVNSVTFGDIDICLPEIKGMKECYLIPIVKARADKFNYEGNSILGYYLNDYYYRHLADFDKMINDDCFQLFATNKMKGLKAGQKELDYVAEMMSENYIKKSMKEVEKIGLGIFDYISIGSSVLIESYSNDKNVRTFVILNKVQINTGTEVVMLSLMDLIILKERLIILSYFKRYVGLKSIRSSKQKNDNFVLQLINSNK